MQLSNLNHCVLRPVMVHAMVRVHCGKFFVCGVMYCVVGSSMYVCSVYTPLTLLDGVLAVLRMLARASG